MHQRSSLRTHRSWRELEPLLKDFFDPIWYRSKNLDLQIDGIDPFEQYVNYGATELRDPCADFQSSFYSANHQQGSIHDEIPVIDYLLRGRHLGYSPKIFHIQDFGIGSDYPISIDEICFSKRVCVLLHLFYTDLYEELARYITNVQFDKDIFVNIVDDTWDSKTHDQILSNFPAANVIISPDRGRDIGGFSRLLSLIDFRKYDLFLFVHSKKSPHLPEPQGRAWRRALLDPIVGSPSKARACVEGMRNSPTIGIAAAKAWRDTNVSGNNYKYQELLDTALVADWARDCEFVAGTMFFIRTEVVKRLHDVIRKIVFEGQQNADPKLDIDGQYAHAVERVIGNLVRDEGFCFWWV